MRELLLALLIGAGAGIIDIAPIILMKIDKYAVVSAFIQWVVLGVIISYCKVLGLDSWLNGLVVAVLLSLPIAVLVSASSTLPYPVRSHSLGLGAIRSNSRL